MTVRAVPMSAASIASWSSPSTAALPFEWFETPNIHLCSIRDFVALCDVLAIEIERGYVVDRKGAIRPLGRSLARANLLGQQAVVLLRQNAG